MDRVAQRLAQRAHDLRGKLTDTPYPVWDEATDAQKEFWREIARASQDPEAPAEPEKPKGKKKG